MTNFKINTNTEMLQQRYADNLNDCDGSADAEAINEIVYKVLDAHNDALDAVGLRSADFDQEASFRYWNGRISKYSLIDGKTETDAQDGVLTVIDNDLRAQIAEYFDDPNRYGV